jgi:hypothetical protein
MTTLYLRDLTGEHRAALIRLARPTGYDSAMIQIAPEQARAYLARWATMARHEVAELQSTTVAQKARQLDALFASRDLFPGDPDSTHENTELIERWRCIRVSCRV